MTRRVYYSARTGKNPNAVNMELPIALKLFREVYRDLVSRSYFHGAFGFECVDAGVVPGDLGSDVQAYMFVQLRKPNLWPIEERCLSYSEDDLFDVVEFLFDCVSQPIDGYYHSYSNCGWHYETFDKPAGQEEYRQKINTLLCDYGDGYELSELGEILALAGGGLDSLYEADLPNHDPDNVESRVTAARLKFRRYRSSMDDRRAAIRDLADVLEFLRPKAKEVLMSKDESDLFNLANNFGIRHHNAEQKTNYHKPIWYSWMFYYYLATIHALLRLIKEHEDPG